jgi:HTH-type transcriptional regulator/antitoxin HigA
MTKSVTQIRPIRTEADHDAAVARIAELMGSAPGTPEGDELDVLATLTDAWEARYQPMDAPDPVTAIQFRMEQQGLSRKELEPMIGSRARVSEVLNGKRKLTIGMIRRVRDELGISADLLIGSPPKRKYGKSTGAGFRPARSTASLRTSGPSSNRKANNR